MDEKLDYDFPPGKITLVDDTGPVRQAVWLKAWCAVAGAELCRHSSVATNWADKCLEAFDERFLKNGAHNARNV